MIQILLFISLLFASYTASAEIAKNRIISSDELTHQRIYIDSNNITFEEFLNAYKSQDQKERRYAEMYFLGVLDYTEGTSWCSYRQFKSGTIAEWIEPQFRKVDEKSKSKRAARVIGAILNKEFPCGGKK